MKCKCFSFKRIVEYTADEHNGFNAVVRREPVDAKIIKKIYEPEIVKHHLAPVAPVVPTAAAPIKYYNAHQQAPELVVAPTPIQKVFTPAVPKFIAPRQQFYVTRGNYAPPENPKFFRPVQKIQKVFQHEYQPQNIDVKYASSPSQYNHY